jgi:putative FmdB family regulatory protein
MPIYEYRCNNCGQHVEILVRSGMSVPPACPDCGSTLLERLLSVPHVIAGERRSPGRTCCGRQERCDSPPCSIDQACRREP